MKPADTDHDGFIVELLGWSAYSQIIELLIALDRSGSINRAARDVGLQYKSAWLKLEQINNLLPFPLLKKQTGGSGGGGTCLTPEGQSMLRRICELQQAFTQFRSYLAGGPEKALETIKTIRRIEMQISARNVWLGQVTSIDRGVVNSVVNIMLKGGDRISSVITDNSVNRLKLEPDTELLAIVKASNVMLGSAIDAGQISARNILTGTIQAITPGAVNDEVTVDLPGGASVTSIITSASVRRLGLHTGKEISAIIKASDVLLAVV
ncbi:TOBE domain-containing protein [Desulfofustis glycolicus]|uniref:Molybdate transport system regulatory protein n=1 Tax=Desulfofustis glycolicus DSM 9705 TaxID=1121409 RepID=A0A1M5XRV1_9BACT|nr:TOBE domain-containing protein [Desulfofustis glycolicus]MCB2217839.1 TOBE domain-containing protein [Desulfobulbaceae bacterium]SHI02402.1 molybdate transport system regulatory protein [Desulfofustis glycolicus DSM 9705]